MQQEGHKQQPGRGDTEDNIGGDVIEMEEKMETMTVTNQKGKMSCFFLCLLHHK